jgi:NADH-quinone oxidoreductase subunit G
MAQLGHWEGARVSALLDHQGGRAASAASDQPRPPAGSLVLSSWKQLIDDGRMQDGDDHYRVTARRPVVLVNRATFAALAASGGVEEGDLVTLTGPLGSLNLPVGVADLVDGAVWAPASAPGFPVRHLVGPAGSTVTVSALSGQTQAEGGSK